MRAGRVVGVVVTWALASAAWGQDAVKTDLQFLQKQGLPTEDKALLEYLMKQTAPEADPAKIDKLTRLLGDDRFKMREEAYAELTILGKTSLVGLKKAEKDNDPEVRRRVKDLIDRLEAKVEPAVQMATVRLVGHHKPAGAATTLLAFLPFAADSAVVDETCRSLANVAKTASGADPAVTKALGDRHPLKRGAAGEALAALKAEGAAVRGLLKDEDPSVRLRVSVALVRTREADAVDLALPAMIDCLAHLPPEHLWPVEDILLRLAGEGKAPSVSLGVDDAGRKKAAEVWTDWYAKNRKAIDLAVLDKADAYLGHTLVVFQNFNRMVGVAGGGIIRRNVVGEIREIDSTKQTKWKLELEDTYPVDAMVIPERPNEVVVAEYQKARVTIRDIKTKNVVWEKQVGGNPIGVQALPGGKIFVTTQNRLLEYDRAAGTEKVVLQRTNHDIFRAKKAKSGEVVCITNSGQMMRYDESGKLLKQLAAPVIPVLFGNIDILPNGNVLVPDYQGGRVVEYDINGTQVSQIAATYPSSAVRLPNGNTLVASQNNRRVIEYNRTGQEVWAYDVEGQVFNARRR